MGAPAKEKQYSKLFKFLNKATPSKNNKARGKVVGELITCLNINFCTMSFPRFLNR
jgi:hypothetical protein